MDYEEAAELAARIERDHGTHLRARIVTYPDHPPRVWVSTKPVGGMVDTYEQAFEYLPIGDLLRPGEGEG
jgi:hypothetical protein